MIFPGHSFQHRSVSVNVIKLLTNGPKDAAESGLDCFLPLKKKYKYYVTDRKVLIFVIRNLLT